MALAAAAAAGRGFAYSVRGGLYLSLTNETNSLSLLESRGPGFSMSKSSGFALLDDGVEPTAEQLTAIVNATYDSAEGRDIIGTGENDPGVCFAGFGEPLLRLETLRETVRLVRETRHGIPWRINTNGLHSVEVAKQVAEFAVDHDGRHPFVVSVMLAAHTPPAYAKQMKPVGDRGFNDVCNFVMALSEAGVTVEATAVAAPGVDVRKTKAVAAGLGARDFRERTFFPDPYTVLDKSWSMAVESVAPTITDEQLNAKHRELQIKYHPDRHATSSERKRAKAAEAFSQINAAYETILAMRVDASDTDGASSL